MITHFQFEPLYPNKQIPGWKVSFFFQGKAVRAKYLKNGDIEWQENYTFSPEAEANIRSQIHELMLFHVYE